MGHASFVPDTSSVGEEEAVTDQTVNYTYSWSAGGGGTCTPANGASALISYRSKGDKIVSVTITATGSYTIKDSETGSTRSVTINETTSLTANIQVIELTIEVKRANLSIWGSSAEIAVGGKSSNIHKADVKIELDPVPSSGFDVDLSLSGDAADGDGTPAVKTSFSIGGISLTGAGNETLSLTAAETSGTLISSNKLGGQSVSAGGFSATITNVWDNYSGSDAWVSDPLYFVQPETSTESITFKLDGVALDGHQIYMFVEEVVYQTEDGSEHTISNTASSPTDVSEYAVFGSSSYTTDGNGKINASLQIKNPSGKWIKSLLLMAYDSSAYKSSSSSGARMLMAAAASSGTGGGDQRAKWAGKGDSDLGVTVTVDPDSIKTGYKLENNVAQGIKAPVTVVVDPVTERVRLTVTKNDPNNRFDIADQEETATGWTLNVMGKSATPANMPEGDAWLEVKQGDTVVKKVPVIVVIPTFQRQATTDLKFINGSKWQDPINKQKIILFTTIETVSRIFILDQFEVVIPDLYNGTRCVVETCSDPGGLAAQTSTHPWGQPVAIRTPDDAFTNGIKLDGVFLQRTTTVTPRNDDDVDLISLRWPLFTLALGGRVHLFHDFTVVTASHKQRLSVHGHAIANSVTRTLTWDNKARTGNMTIAGSK